MSTNDSYHNSDLEDEIDEQPTGYVCLAQSGVTDRDIPIVVERALGEKKCVKLNLENNEITRNGLQILVEALHDTRNTTLKHLILAGNPLTDDSAGHLSRLLDGNLIELNLEDIELTDRGVQIITNAMRKNKCLKKLDLSSNRGITEACFECLRGLLQDNRTMRHLYLRNCLIAESEKANVLQAISRNCRIHFNSHENDVDDDETLSSDEEEMFLNDQKTFRLIWLDDHSHISPDNLNTKSMLRELDPTAQFTTDIPSTINFIRTIPEEQIFLVVTSAFARESLSQTCTICAVQAVFIFGANDGTHQSFTNEFSKLEGTFTETSKLLARIQEVIALTYKRSLVFSIFNQKQDTTRELSKEATTFLWYQVAFHILRQMPADKEAKDTMLEVCRNYYIHNKQELKKIKEYENTERADQAILWYTKDTGLFKLLNKALRTQDMVLIYQFRYFIIRLWDQIEIEDKKRKNNTVQTVYRGQEMSIRELNKLQNNIGAFISVNSFLSASIHRDVAIIFAPERSTANEMFTGVLFEIELDPNIKSVFADIRSVSNYSDEGEILFSFGTTFKILSVELDSNLDRWVVQLNATNEGTDRIQEFYELANEERIRSKKSLTIYFGDLLRQKLGQRDKEIQYYRMLLKSMPSNHLDFGYICENSGALNLLAVEDEKKIREGDNTHLTTHGQTPYHPTPSIREQLTTMRNALLEEEWKNPGVDSVVKAKILQDIGELSPTYDDEIFWYNRSFTMYSRVLSSAHPTVVQSLRTLGETYREKGDYEQALQCFNKVLEMDEQNLPMESPQILDDLKCIVFLYQRTDNHSKAIQFCHDKIAILLARYDEDHRAIMNLREYMNELTRERTDFEYRKKRKFIELEVCQPHDTKRRRNILYQLSSLFYSQQCYSTSLRFALQAFKLLTNLDSVLPDDLPDVADFLKHIAKCYFHTQEYRPALYYIIEGMHNYSLIGESAITEWSDCAEMIGSIAAQALQNKSDLSATPNTIMSSIQSLFDINESVNMCIRKNLARLQHFVTKKADNEWHLTRVERYRLCLKIKHIVHRLRLQTDNSFYFLLTMSTTAHQRRYISKYRRSTQRRSRRGQLCPQSQPFNAQNDALCLFNTCYSFLFKNSLNRQRINTIFLI